jgi:hypothetical protein
MLSRKVARVKAGKFSIAYRGLKLSKAARTRFLNRREK